MILKKLLIILSFAPFLFCASTAKTGVLTKNEQRNDWTIYHPVSSTHFIGVGSAKISENMNEVQKSARNKALEDISSQIIVKVIGNTVVEETQKIVGKKIYDTSLFKEKISTYTEAILGGVEIAETKYPQDGYCWVKLILEKNAYFAKLNEKINNSKQIAIDALSSSENAGPIKKIIELHTALKTLDGFSGDLLRCQFNGQQIILNTEIIRRLRQTLDDIAIKPSISELEIGAIDTPSDTLGFYVIYQNLPIEHCSLRWSVSCNDIQLTTRPEMTSGLHPVYISNLTSSAGKVTISARLEIPEIEKDLISRGLSLPEGKFILSRKRPTLFHKEEGEFIESVTNELANINMFSVIEDENQADYLIVCTFHIDPDIIINRSIFQASGIFNCTISRPSEKASIEIHRKVTTGNGKSQNATVQSLKNEALKITIKEITKIF